MNLVVGDSMTVLNPIDMMAMNELYCWASSTPKFNGVQAVVSFADLPTDSAIKATLMGSTAMYEDEDGYMTCDKNPMTLLGGASISASGSATQTIEVRTSPPMPSWSCALKLSAVVMKDANGPVEPVVEAALTSTWISCPE